MRCKTCHYSLTKLGLAENRCPKCGREFDPLDPETFERVHGSGGRMRISKWHFVVIALFSLVFPPLVASVWPGVTSEQFRFSLLLSLILFPFVAPVMFMVYYVGRLTLRL